MLWAFPTFEDKILQRAVADGAGAGLRGGLPGRLVRLPTRTTALTEHWQSCGNRTMKLGGGWIVDVDLRKFFDTIDHGHLREFLKRRVRDGVILRLIGKWLNAGVLEEGVHNDPRNGYAPRRGDQPAALANIFLHYVLDEWFEKEVRPRLKGEAFLIRYADDFVIGVAREDDARRIMDVLPKRMSKYGLTVHPEKTRLVRFRTAPSRRLRHRGTGPTRPRTFDFLGFTHYWGTIPARRMGGQTEDGEEPTQAARSQRCRNGVGKICTCRSRTNTRSSSRNCEATTGITGSLATSPASRNSGRQRGGSGDAAVAATPRRRHDVGRLPSPGAALQSSPCPSGPRPTERRSEVMR